MNKIAVFMNRRSKEYLSYLCRGFEDYMNDHSVAIHMYLCFGKLGVKEAMSESEREIQYGFYQFPDLRRYDGVILPMVTMQDRHIADFLLEKVRAAGVPCVMIEQECEGMSWVGINQGKAIREITAHMIEQHGYQKSAIWEVRQILTRLICAKKLFWKSWRIMGSNLTWTGSSTESFSMRTE